MKRYVSMSLFFWGLLCAQSYDERMIDQLGVLEPQFLEALCQIPTNPSSVKSSNSLRNPALLYDRYPELKKTIPHVSCAQFPTSVNKANRLGQFLGIKKLYVKNDGSMSNDDKINGQLIGGNKVRKLEFLLADALDNGARKIITFGALGSNHVVTTALCAKLFGLEVQAMLLKQPVTDVVKSNVSLDLIHGAHLNLWHSNAIRQLGTCFQMMQDKQQTGMFPYIIPTGGSNGLGALGYVNAAFELQEQVKAGILEEPDFIYVPVGSGGTAAGLLLGCKLAGLRSTIVAVAVFPETVSGKFVSIIKNVYEQANKLLHEHDATIALYDFETCNLIVNLANTGPKYGIDTEFGHMMRIQFYEYEGLVLEPTYTSKAAAALYRDAKELKDKTVLFWLTFNQAHIPDLVLDKQLQYPYAIARALQE